MGKKWTLESAKSYINMANKGKVTRGLKYWSAVDFVTNHFKVAIDQYISKNEEKEEK